MSIEHVSTMLTFLPKTQILIEDRISSLEHALFRCRREPQPPGCLGRHPEEAGSLRSAGSVRRAHQDRLHPLLAFLDVELQRVGEELTAA